MFAAAVIFATLWFRRVRTYFLRSCRFRNLFAMALLSLTIALSVQASPLALAAPVSSKAERCISNKQLDQWDNRKEIESRGFKFDLVGSQAHVAFDRHLSLDLASDPTSRVYTASRITEIDTSVSIAQRVKCWQATDKKNVVVEFRVRFDEAATPQGLTENLILWNAPFPSTIPEPLRPVTTIGVSRNSAFGQPQYVAVVTQDVDYATFTPPFILNVKPMPAWLDASAWHKIRLTLSQTTAKIEVAQSTEPYSTVLEVTLLHQAEPLGFEFSVDNEFAPGHYAPVTVADGLDVDYLRIRMEPKN